MTEIPEDVRLELERLRAENESLKSQSKRGVHMKVSDKGALSLYGLGRFPVTLYIEQWEKIIAMAPEIQRFMADNADKLKRKE
jgi:hypothetical protein